MDSHPINLGEHISDHPDWNFETTAGSQCILRLNYDIYISGTLTMYGYTKVFRNEMIKFSR